MGDGQGVGSDGLLAARVDRYIEGLFVGRDAALEQGLADAEAAGLPPIAISPNEGKLLHLLARLLRPRRILELGTLGGYSATWLARALEPGGRLVSLELEPASVEVARRNLARAGVADRVEVRVGPAAASLRAMLAGGEAPFDLVFIDADKEGYPEYLELALQLVRPGALVIADNVVRDGEVLDPSPDDPSARAIRAFNARLAAHPRLDSIIVPLFRDVLDGISLSIVKG
jgi:predicted O-methyltransferase YrrM